MRSIVLAVLLLAAAPALAQRAKADLDCKPARVRLTYDCTIQLSRDGKPLDGAHVSAGADMPSMPMAHNVAPVNAVPGLRPGEYRVRLRLEMTGAWAVKLRVSGSVKDLIIIQRDFD